MFDWSPERDAELADRRDKGESFAQIGLRLGVSRNACIGRAMRIDLPRIARVRNPNVRHADGPSPSRIRKNIKKPTRFKPRLDAPQSKQLPICETLPEHCRYIAGDDHLCCGHDTIKESSWCEYHWKVVHQPAQMPVRRTPFIDFHRRVA